MVKNLPAVKETHVWTLGQKDPLEKGMATHSSILAGEFPGQKNLAGYSPWDLKRVGQDWPTNTSTSRLMWCITFLKENIFCYSFHHLLNRPCSMQCPLYYVYIFIFIFSTVLRYNWQNCKIFKVYNVMVWHKYTLWKFFFFFLWSQKAQVVDPLQPFTWWEFLNKWCAFSRLKCSWPTRCHPSAYLILTRHGVSCFQAYFTEEKSQAD